jgi:hypothetical protein
VTSAPPRTSAIWPASGNCLIKIRRSPTGLRSM